MPPAVNSTFGEGACSTCSCDSRVWHTLCCCIADDVGIGGKDIPGGRPCPGLRPYSNPRSVLFGPMVGPMVVAVDDCIVA